MKMSFKFIKWSPNLPGMTLNILKETIVNRKWILILFGKED